MSKQPYHDPIYQLLTIGEPEDPWPDYVGQYGLSPADIPELICLVSDRDLRWEDAPEELEAVTESTVYYAQIHAWRALAQLQAVEAIPALLDLLEQVEVMDDDWLGQEAPDVFATLGPAAIEPLSAYLADQGHSVYERITAGESLEMMAKRRPETRQECIQGIAAALKDYQQNDETVNGFIIANLVTLEAVEHIALIEQAYAADRVDDTIIGDYEDVQVAMGLLSERQTPARRPPFEPLLSPVSRGRAPQPAPKPRRAAEKKEKTRRKQSKQSRKKNRKKK